MGSRRAMNTSGRSRQDARRGHPLGGARFGEDEAGRLARAGANIAKAAVHRSTNSFGRIRPQIVDPLISYQGSRADRVRWVNWLCERHTFKAQAGKRMGRASQSITLAKGRALKRSR